MKNNYNPVWVFIDRALCDIQPVSYQLVGHARLLANMLETEVQAIFLGNGITSGAERIIAAGADSVYISDHPRLEFYNAELYTEIIVKLALDIKPQILLIGSTYVGRELAPLLAAKLKTGLTAHCIDLVVGPGRNLHQKIPAYGGLMTIITPRHRPQMATVAQGVFPHPIMDFKRKGKIINIDCPKHIDLRIETLEISQDKPEENQLEEADIVVAGGAGVENYQGWRLIAELASLLNAGLGCTRPVVDNGWAEYNIMIGQSGKVTNPKVYIGIGISGEQQHMVGIKNAQLMVGINVDKHAPIFNQVDIGIISDCRKFIPLFIEGLKEYRKILECQNGRI